MNNEWQHNIQLIIDKIDACIRSKNSEALTLSALAQEFGYSEYHFSRKFRELSGIQLRDYLRYRKLALAAKRVRDSGEVPPQMLLSDIPGGDYIVFEHGPFYLETDNSAAEAKIEKAMKNFDYSASGYVLDTSPGRAFYFYHDYKRYWKYIRPVRKR